MNLPEGPGETNGHMPSAVARECLGRQMTLRHPLVRVFAIDLVPEVVRTGRAHEEVERSRPETVALSDRLQPAYQKVLERDPGGGVGSGQRCS
jgi:hypothetical protein